MGGNLTQGIFIQLNTLTKTGKIIYRAYSYKYIDKNGGNLTQGIFIQLNTLTKTGKIIYRAYSYKYIDKNRGKSHTGHIHTIKNTLTKMGGNLTQGIFIQLNTLTKTRGHDKINDQH